MLTSNTVWYSSCLFVLRPLHCAVDYAIIPCPSIDPCKAIDLIYCNAWLTILYAKTLSGPSPTSSSQLPIHNFKFTSQSSSACHSCVQTLLKAQYAWQASYHLQKKPAYRALCWEKHADVPEHVCTYLYAISIYQSIALHIFPIFRLFFYSYICASEWQYFMTYHQQHTSSSNYEMCNISSSV